ncbi:MAG: hypothetical protein PHO08_09905 [Methylococcales bacterium]|nr:hypothetical protein [Methylococcales bacterium]
MSFYQEPTHYEKTILSDLQGAWEVLRDAVIKEQASKDCSQLLFHINEAMSWESVRNLNHMKNTFVLVQSIAQQTKVSDEIMGLIEDVKDVLYEVSNKIQHGKIL